MEYHPNSLRFLPLAVDWAKREFERIGKTYGADQLPYIVHLRAVEEVLLRFGFNDPENPVYQNLRIASYSHDLVEDVGIRIETIRGLQGVSVAILVAAVTDPPTGTREERHAVTYPRIRATPWATVLKLADRIANMEASLAAHGQKLAMYLKEYHSFREALYVSGGPEEAMRAHLDALAVQGQAGFVPAERPVSTPGPEVPWIL